VEKSSCLAPEQVRALAALNRIKALEGFYLAGGSAVSAHLNHRRSLDLDLFSSDPKVDLSRVGRLIAADLDSTEVVSLTDAALTLRVDDLAIDVVCYPYPPLEAPQAGPGGFLVAGLRDLAAMKLSAIARRGIRRDFWDLHEIATSTSVSLEIACDAYRARFGVAEADLYHVIRSLSYFEDAETETVLPLGLTEAHWLQLKEFFLNQVPGLLRSVADDRVR
jgi:hypothetical protein